MAGSQYSIIEANDLKGTNGYYDKLRSLQGAIGISKTEVPSTLATNQTATQAHIKTLIDGLNNLIPTDTTVSNPRVYFSYSGASRISVPERESKIQYKVLTDITTLLNSLNSVTISNSKNSDYRCTRQSHGTSETYYSRQSICTKCPGDGSCGDYSQDSSGYCTQNGDHSYYETYNTWAEYVGYKVNSASVTGNCSTNTCQKKL